MTPALLAVLALACVALGLGLVWRRRALATERLGGDELDLDDEFELEREGRSALARSRWWGAVAALVAGGVAAWRGASPAVAVSVGVLFGALGFQFEAFWHARRQVRYEQQLAEALDLMVGALRAGVGIVDALTAGAARVGQPLRALLVDLVERLRLGEAPVEVLTSISRRVPLESYRLTGLTLGASWEGGGGYADALAGVGRATRERLALRRRLHAQSLEARTSVFVVLAVTWGLFAFTVQRDPAATQAFLDSEPGEFLLCGVLWLEALGLVWIDSLARAEA